MSIKVGISPIAWQNDDLPDLTAAYSMDQALSEASDIGYMGVERGRRMPAETDKLSAYLQQNNLELCGGWCSGNLMVNSVADEIKAISQQVEQFVALRSPCLVYAECSNTIQGDRDTPVNNRPRLSRTEIEHYASKLSEVGKWMTEQGMVLAYHHHMGSMIESQEDIDCLMSASTDDVSLLFDTGHLHFGGGDIMATLETWGHRIKHVHFKDVRESITHKMRVENRSFLDAVIAGAFTVPGDPQGCIDFQAVTDKLKQMDYAGWIVVEAEQDPSLAAPYEYSKLGYAHIVEICKNSGLSIATRN
ncbi:MAG: myo-inosose-2 dehydratase [Granulosicoccus sp.]